MGLMRFVGIFLLLTCGGLFPGVMLAQASLIVGGTRLIYQETAKEMTVQITNPELTEKLAQAWVDAGDPDVSPDNAEVPFLIMPPLTRIKGLGTHRFRLVFTHQIKLPKDRESLFWFNVLDIPPIRNMPTDGYLELAYRTRIKLFYRPSGLASSATDAGDSVVWKMTKSNKEFRLKAINNSPYYVSLNRIVLTDAGKRYSSEGELIVPKGSRDFIFPGLSAFLSDEASIEYQWIDDYGEIHQRREMLGR
ncbi:molecular chaperone EcpD [Serratia fonticola]|uniref:fimbrial biogenesis chaperone n=1 Tax=Serratia fonticola TaxID=47917 RepID=UPI000BFBDF1D|nr:fimbria/pilus periplasmic chaperone [Serratia fonticola]ATM75902.1 molecular chaperone EcpD [Serratia fonticola]